MNNKINIKEININEIIVEDRLRSSTNAEKINELAESIKKIGLQHPIVITENNKLLSGLHRLLAYKKLKRIVIPCNIFDAEKTDLFKTSPLDSKEKTDIIYRIVEAEENILRAELDYVDRGEHLLQLKKDYEILFPETKHGANLKRDKGKTRSDQKIGVIETITPKNNGSSNASKSKKNPSFVKKIAEQTGRSEATIYQEMQIVENIVPEVKKIIREENIPKKDALKIAQIKNKNPDNYEEEQKQALDKIINEKAKKKSKVKKEDKNEPDKCNAINCLYLQAVKMKTTAKECEFNKEFIDMIIKKGCIHQPVGFKLTKKVILKLLNHLEGNKIIDDCIIYVMENSINSVTVDNHRNILMQMRMRVDTSNSLQTINTGKIPIDIANMKSFLKRFSLKDELELIYENGIISITKTESNLNKVKAILDAKRISAIRYDFITNLKNKIKDKDIETDFPLDLV